MAEVYGRKAKRRANASEARPQVCSLKAVPCSFGHAEEHIHLRVQKTASEPARNEKLSVDNGNVFGKRR
ncbi:hypothetical protein HRbin30_03189 [bacterium HR30]|nr:hypothetical protein HRbin30_03189 [bacterium HR30]